MEDQSIPEKEPEEVTSQPEQQPQTAAPQGEYRQPVYQQPYYQPNGYQPPVYQQNVYGQYTQPVQPQQPKPKKDHKKAKKAFGVAGVLIGAVALSVVVALLTTAIVSGVWGNRYDVLNQAMSNKINVLQDQIAALEQNPGLSVGAEPVTDEMLPKQVYAQTVETVVSVSNTVTGSYFGQTTQGVSTGSGVILSEDGYVATNYHVVEGGTQLSVTTYAGQTYDAKLVGYDAANDIAVLKVEATGLPYAQVGSSENLQVGDRVAAIGNPLGELTATMTVGYVSAKDRLVSTDGTSINMLQTDAAINSGNSGGPLFDMYGKVVGITTAKYSGTSNSGASIEGIGFAIPIDDVVDIIDDLMNYGYITGAYLGVMVRDLDSSVASTYGLPMGVYVDEVTPGYCAETAGIKAGDIIIDLGGYEVTCMSELTRALRKLNAGDQTTITVFRGGTQVHLEIVLSEKPPQTQEPEPEPETQPTQPQYNPYDDWFDDFFGWGW